MQSDNIVILEDDLEAARQIETELLKSLRATLEQSENLSFVLSARDPHGALAGGLTAFASYGWLLVKTLWVSDDFRNHGLGRSLMARAEKKAKALGCHSVWLDTSNPDAMRFYAKLGYETFGQLANSEEQHPSGHRRWFMKKQL